MPITEEDREVARAEGERARKACPPDERLVRLTTHLLKRAAERAETDRR